MKMPYYACRSKVNCEIKIKLPDESEIITQRPRLHDFQHLLSMQEQLKEADKDEKIQITAEMLAVILSKNKDGRTFTAEYLLTELEPEDMKGIMNMFFGEVNKITQDPN